VAKKQNTKEFYINAYTNAPVGIAQISLKGFFLRANPVACQFFGYSETELLGKRFTEITHPTDLVDSEKLVKELVGGKRSSFSLEKRYIKKDKSTIWSNTKVTLQHDTKGKPLHFIVIVEDISDRKQSGEDLRKLSVAVEQSPACVVMTDPDGNIEYVNPKFTKLTGYKSNEVIGANPRILKSGGQTLEFYKELWDKISQGNAWVGEFHNKKKNGDLYWEHASISPILDDKGKITHYVAVKEDITRQKQAEQRLIDSEKKFKTLYDSAKDAIMILEPPTWKFTSGNPSTIQMFKAKNEKDFTSQPPWQYSPKRQPDGKLSSTKAREMITAAMKKGTIFFEWTHKRLNGEEFAATVLLTRMKLHNKLILQATVRDITERKDAESSIKERIKELNGLYNLGKLTEDVADKKRLLTRFVNETAPASMRFPDKAHVRIDLDREIYCNYRRKIKSNLASCLSVPIKVNGKKRGKLTIGYLKKLAIIEVFEEQLINGYAERIGRIIERLEAEQKLREAYESLKEEAKHRDEFINITAHELKSPLLPILGYVELLQEEKAESHLTPDQKKLLSIIKRNALRLSGLIRDIVDVARLQTKRMKFNFRKATIESVLNEVEQRFGKIAKDRGLDLQFVVRPGLPKIRMDKNRLVQVFSNLVHNSIKFTTKGTISIQCKRRKDKLIVQLTDTGQGIPGAAQTRIFEKFFQAESSLTRKHGGSGLGLAIVKGILDEHGGTISVKSQYKRGSTFTVILPID